MKKYRLIGYYNYGPFALDLWAWHNINCDSLNYGTQKFAYHEYPNFINYELDDPEIFFNNRNVKGHPKKIEVVINNENGTMKLWQKRDNIWTNKMSDELILRFL